MGEAMSVAHLVPEASPSAPVDRIESGEGCDRAARRGEEKGVVAEDVAVEPTHRRLGGRRLLLAKRHRHPW